ncbi:MAG: diguanylate cyclase [Kofleriaceae bacterium]|jgi:diguanylate cyclase (GGDEF)-like protein|nr:diguanylate cyclase [Kofleriaceae bacterium]MBP6839083.1 diguanylate cyclase [Kofleriaceae bacterium]MBP9202355.1 diguanylate cyclase [Kofleriaceae bacterium]
MAASDPRESLGVADATAELATIWRRFEGDADAALRAVTETAARSLAVGRASIWLLDDDRRVLRCVDLFQAAEASHSAGTSLGADTFPRYFTALEQEETIAAEDAHADPRTAEFSQVYLAPLGIGAMLDLPIRTGRRLVGVLCSEHLGPARTWTSAEIKDAAFLATLASLALELKQRAQAEALLAATLESTAEAILAFDQRRPLAYNRRFVEMWRLDPAALTSIDGIRAAMQAQLVALPGLISSANEAFAGVSGETTDVLELIDGRVVERSSRPQRLADEVIGRVWSFRDITAHRRAEEVLRASEAQMRDLAHHDELTGVANRRHILASAAAAVATGERVCLAVLDLDHFKKINDEHGHLVGDAVLREVAAYLRGRLRSSDAIGRYGGEEFVIMLRGTSRERARGVLDELRLALRAARSPGLPAYTFSAGVAESGADGADVPTLLACADERLYQAKRAGRDRVVA